MTAKTMATAGLALVFACLRMQSGSISADEQTRQGNPAKKDESRAATPGEPITIANDKRLALVMHEPTRVMAGGQPFLFCSSRGTLVCQSHGHGPPFGTKNKMAFPSRLQTCISRDGGASWQRFVHKENHDEVFLEGGVLQCADGSILMLDSYVMPSEKPDQGVGELWKSHDDWHSLEGPFDAEFHLPTIDFAASSDDSGRPHRAARLHRSILETPNGDLLTTMYSWFKGDTAPIAYRPSMKKARAVVIRSRDRGATWSYLSTVAVDAGVGTEGFTEPVLERVARGHHAGRLICLMRTGRDLYEAHSDDDGTTWSRHVPLRFPGVNIYHTEQWESLFVDKSAPGYVPADDMIGAIVDPDLIAMGDGTLVCAFGARMPAQRCFEKCSTPRNGNYLAFSCDAGDTWSHVVQITSGVVTGHYMGVREVAPGVLYVVYDVRPAGQGPTIMGLRLEVR